MIIYAYQSSYYYEAHLDMTTREVLFILRWRDGHEQRPTRITWDDLDDEEQDLLLPKIRKAVKQYEQDHT